MAGIIESGQLKATIGSNGQLQGNIDQTYTVRGDITVPKIIDHKYYAGNGIVIDEQRYISIDELIIDCGQGTTV